MFDLNRIRTKVYLGNIRCDVLLTEYDLLRKDILAFYGDFDVNFVVTVFDPNRRSVLAHGRDDLCAGRPRPWVR